MTIMPPIMGRHADESVEQGGLGCCMVLIGHESEEARGGAGRGGVGVGVVWVGCDYSMDASALHVIKTTWRK